jgi:hypothetical protein
MAYRILNAIFQVSQIRWEFLTKKLLGEEESRGAIHYKMELIITWYSIRVLSQIQIE